MLVALLFVAPVPSACGGSVFACEDASDCNDGAQGGVCEPNGWCSFPDASCESGARYGALAGDGLAGQCVDEPDGTTSEDPATTATTMATSTTTSASTTVDPDTTATSSTTSPTDPTEDTAMPVCPDGQLDEGEDCDDGNAIAGDGCSPDCQLSGSEVWSRTIDGGMGQGHSLDLFANGDLAVGFVNTTDGGAVPGVWRVDPNGELLWAWAYTAEQWTLAYAWGLDVENVENDENSERIVVAVEGYENGAARAGVAMLDDAGGQLWSDGSNDVLLYGAILQTTGQTIVVGRDLDAVGIGGLLRQYGPLGGIISSQIGEPNVPSDGFAFDLVADGDAFYFAGQHGELGNEAAFYGATVGAVAVRYDFALGVHNEGLAIALDPRSSRRWLAGYAEDLGGWVAAITPEGLDLGATIVTDAFSANLHGIALDPSGAAVAVGWDSANGSRDGFVVKVAPDGTRVWSSTFVTAGADDDLRDVAVASDGSIFVVGTRVGDNGVPTGWIAQLVP